MRYYLPESRPKQFPKCSMRAVLLVLLGFMILPAISQFTTYDKYIYLSGQLTDVTTGAPISDHELYVFSDSLTNNGFGYYAVTRTDVNGFYWDTILTNQSDGLLNISVYDFEDNLISLDRYYRFVWESNYFMFVDLAIFDPNSNTEFQANFRYESDTLEENPMMVHFKDISIGPSIKAWLWDFGDGTYSEVQDPDHVYEKSGNYLVTLTVCSFPSSYEFFDTSIITKQVQAGMAEYHDLGGHVFAEYFPIDYGLAYLYVYDTNDHLVPLDTTTLNSLGYYLFHEVPAGKYITKARLQNIAALYGQYMPTYFGDVYIWEDAEDIVLDDDNFECDIWLLPSTGINSGQGQILGQVNYDTTRTTSVITPAGNIEILLLDEAGASLTCGLSDIEGYFRFAGIEYGLYQLYPDVTGISTTPMYVTLTEEEPTVTDVSLVIYPEEITFAIHENVSDFIENAMFIYPNPAVDQARISIGMKKSSGIEIRVLDPSGRTVYRENELLNEGENQLTLDTRNFPAGYYQVVLIPEDQVFVTGKFLKFR